MDFAKLVEMFDRHDVTFVSVTQTFNTTTSMGRLTLNILLVIRAIRARSDRRAHPRQVRRFPGTRHVDGRLGAARLRRARSQARGERGRGRRQSGGSSTASQRSAPLRSWQRCLRSEGVTTKRGKPINKADIYKLLNNRTYVGEVVHKGNVYPGEHEGIISRGLWDRVHRILQESPRARANKNRAQSPALLRGLIFGVDGRAMSPTHTRRHGKLYRYYVSQSVLKGDGGDSVIRRVSAAEIETAVIDQVRALLRQPEIVVGTWMAARSQLPDLTEEDAREALERLDPLWEQLFPAEQARIIRLLVERVEIGPAGADIRLRIAGLTSLVRDLAAARDDAVAAAA